MNKIVDKAIKECNDNKVKFFKYISLSDAGKSRGHQAGIYIPKQGAKLMFDTACKKGENKVKLVTIEWFDGVIVEKCKFLYYGKGTRNEFRITCTNRKLREQDFLVMVKISEDYYKAFTFSIEDDVKYFYKNLN